MSSQQGARANRTGIRLEKFIESLLDREGYRKVIKANFEAEKSYKEPIFTTQYLIGKNIYEKDRKVDFLIYHPVKWQDDLVIEAKWQQRPGSVEEKYPFLCLSIEKLTFRTIVILDGGGYSKGAEEWLRAQAGKDKMLIKVMNMAELQIFANNEEL